MNLKSALPWLVGVAGLSAGIGIAAYYGRQALKSASHPAVNWPLPQDLTGRLVYAGSAAVRDDIADLTGRIVTIQADGRGRKSSERLLVPGPPPYVERISDGLVYESKICCPTSETESCGATSLWIARAAPSNGLSSRRVTPSCSEI